MKKGGRQRSPAAQLAAVRPLWVEEFTLGAELGSPLDKFGETRSHLSNSEIHRKEVTIEAILRGLIMQPISSQFFL
jgi:hypothetical protein